MGRRNIRISSNASGVIDTNQAEWGGFMETMDCRIPNSMTGMLRMALMNQPKTIVARKENPTACLVDLAQAEISSAAEVAKMVPVTTPSNSVGKYFLSVSDPLAAIRVQARPNNTP